MKLGIKRSIISGVVAVALTATMAIPAMAADLTIQQRMEQEKQNAAQPTEQTTPLTFRDIPSTHWAHSSISAMTAKGLFGGKVVYDDNTALFAPDDTMTRAEFTAVVVRALYKSDLDIMPSASPWWSNAYKVAVDKGILQSNELENGTMDKGMSRQEMALVLVRAAEQKGESASKLVDTSKIADYSTVGSYYKDSVVKAFSMGMLAGTDAKGTYNPQATMNRAQGAAVLNRLVDSSSRIKVDFSTPSDTVSGAIVIQEGQARSNRLAQAGDTVVKADGTKVVLKVGPNGVLGEGQGVAADLGLQSYVNGSVVSIVADNGVRFNGTSIGKDSLGNTVHNQYYRVNDFTKEGHWSAEWSHMSKEPTQSGEFNYQLSADHNWLWLSNQESWAFLPSQTLAANGIQMIKDANGL